MTTRACKRESFVLYFHFVTARNKLLLGYFAQIVRSEPDRITAKEL